MKSLAKAQESGSIDNTSVGQYIKFCDGGCVLDTLLDSASDDVNLERVINLLSHNVPDIPAQYVLTKPMTYEELTQDLSTTSSLPVTVLAPVLGPYPYYRFPKSEADQGEKISLLAHNVFILPRDQQLLLITVRDEMKDKTIVFEYPKLNPVSGTMQQVLSPLVDRDGRSIRTIKDCSNGANIEQEEFSIQTLQGKPTFPTIAFIDTANARFNFRTEVPIDSPQPIKDLSIYADNLVQKACKAPQDSIQKIHLARAALHLVACAADAAVLDLEQVDYYLELESVLEMIEKAINFSQAEQPTLKEVYHELCEDRPGAFEIRRSYEKFLELQRMDSQTREVIRLTSGNSGLSTASASKGKVYEESGKMGITVETSLNTGYRVKLSVDGADIQLTPNRETFTWTPPGNL
ncbi:hypothetical protein FRC17_010243, partial [Serendipita sp. 399]